MPATADVLQQEGARSAVSALAVLPDGVLASAWYDGTIRLWDPVTGAETVRLKGAGEGVTALAALPNGRLVSGSLNGTIQMWDTVAGIEHARVTGDGYIVTALAALPDGRLVSGSHRALRLWETTGDGEIVPQAWPWQARRDDQGALRKRVFALAVLWDGRLAVSSCDGIIWLLDMATGVPMPMTWEYLGFVEALAALPDGRLAWGAQFGNLQVWDVKTGAENVRLVGDRYNITALAPVPDGRLFSASEGGVIRLWDTAGGREIAYYWDGAAIACRCGEIAYFCGDATITCLAVLPDCTVVGGDTLGRLHWLQIIE
jgi:WD40 repeat protein